MIYGLVAKLSGLNSPRAVGNILHKNPNPEKIPCHRVVNNQGKVAKKFGLGGAEGQIRKLMAEGVRVKNNRVDLYKFLWDHRSVDTLQAKLR